MPRKRYKTEQIVAVLRQVEVLVANGRLTRKPVVKQGSANRRTIAGARSMAD
jgi:hypothetical protein